MAKEMPAILSDIRTIWERLKYRHDPENPGEAFAPDGGCIECCSVRPNDKDTGLCPYHAMERLLSQAPAMVADGIGLHRVIADIREAAGIGGQIMLYELADEIRRMREELDRLRAQSCNPLHQKDVDKVSVKK